MPSQLRAVYITAETVPGNHEAAAAGDVIAAESVTWTPQPAQIVRDAIVRPYPMGIRTAGPGPVFVDVGMTTEVKAAADYSAAPEVGRILRAAGYEEVLVARATATCTIAGVASPGGDVIYTAQAVGTMGNGIIVQHVDDGVGAPLDVRVLGMQITVGYDVAAGAPDSDVVAAAVNAFPGAFALVSAVSGLPGAPTAVALGNEATGGGADYRAEYVMGAAPNAPAHQYALSWHAEETAEGSTYQAYGIRCGSLEIRSTPGERVTLSWSGVGGYRPVLDVTAPPLGVTWDVGMPLVLATTVTVGGAIGCVRSWALSIPIQVTRRECGGGHAWPAYVAMTGSPQVTVQIEMPPPALADHMAQWLSGEAHAEQIIWGSGSRTLGVDLAVVQWASAQVDYQQPTLVTLVGHVSRSDGVGYDVRWVWR